MNKLNIDDVVKVIHPGMGDDGKEGPVIGIQKWPNGTIVYMEALKLKMGNMRLQIMKTIKLQLSLN